MFHFAPRIIGNSMRCRAIRSNKIRVTVAQRLSRGYRLPMERRETDRRTAQPAETGVGRPFFAGVSE